jgi:hypothetical protein
MPSTGTSPRETDRPNGESFPVMPQPVHFNGWVSERISPHIGEQIMIFEGSPFSDII